MASIIAGRDVAGSPATYLNPTRFNGIAPDANLVSVKVGANDGSVDVTQIIAAIDWTVEHRNDNGLNIRVINLSYGTDGIQDPMIDPMDFAVENAWKHGIVVVVAGGNDGTDKTSLANPARDPYVLAVGADDTQGTWNPSDDSVPDWGTGGTDARHVDVVAPGISVLGLRVNNGYCDERNPLARVGDRFAKASGTSQATAVVSGEVALLLQKYPTMTPDQVKRQLMSSAIPFASSTTKDQGSGVTNVALAELKKPEKYVQKGVGTGTGTGSIEASRGTSHVYDGVSELTGEFDIFGNPWDGAAWAAADVAGTVWDAGRWRGFGWSGNGWDARTWRSVVWTSGTWSARTWRDSEWSARTWRDGAWTGDTWSARTWRDSEWSARTWRDANFDSVGWQ
jgi:serine protease AprX